MSQSFFFVFSLFFSTGMFIAENEQSCVRLEKNRCWTQREQRFAHTLYLVLGDG